MPLPSHATSTTPSAGRTPVRSARSLLNLLVLTGLAAGCALPTPLQPPLSSRCNPPELISIEGRSDGIVIRIEVPAILQDETAIEARGALVLYRAELVDPDSPLRYKPAFTLDSSDERVAKVFDQGSVTLKDVKVEPGSSYIYRAQFNPTDAEAGLFSAPVPFTWHTPPPPPDDIRLLADGPAVRIVWAAHPDRRLMVYRRLVGEEKEQAHVRTCDPPSPCVDLDVARGNIYSYSFSVSLITEDGSISGPLSREWYIEVP